MTKTAVVLFNLGGPDSLQVVPRFLSNLFTDPAIIRLPKLIRYPLAVLISWARTKKAKEIYRELGGKSLLLGNTIEQAEALEGLLGDEYKVFVSMRYWHPMAKEVVGKVKNYGPDKVVLLPLYPQYSTTTTASSFAQWHLESEKQGLKVATREISNFPTLPGFVNTIADMIMANGKKYRILFSAHGLPEQIIKSGDPYQKQVESTVDAIKLQLGDDLDTRICYQSRVGLQKWIGPSTEEEILLASKQGISVIVVPISFVSENSETKYELDIQYRALAKGIDYERLPTVGTRQPFIQGLSELVKNA